MKNAHLTPAPQYSAGTQPLPQRCAWRGVLSRLTLFLGLATLLTLLGGATFVGAATISPHQAAASTSCQTIRATLHGLATPSFSCLDGQQRKARTLSVGGSGPFVAHQIIEDACYDDDLDLHWDSNLGGTILCINGSGVLNLTDVWNYNHHTSWNDQVSSFWTGCYSDYFYSDINQGGGIAWAPGSPGGFYSEWDNFPLGGVANDALSSIWQYYNWGGPHCGS